MPFDMNEFDGHTLPKVLLELKRLNKLKSVVGLCDPNYKGKRKINGTRIIMPGSSIRDTDCAYKVLTQKRIRKRVRIE